MNEKQEIAQAGNNLPANEQVLVNSYYLATSASSCENFDRFKHLVVNETRKAFDCDRVTLVVFDNGRPKITAITGQVEVSKTSEHVKLLKKVTRKLTRKKQPEAWIKDALPDKLPGGLLRSLVNYFPKSQAEDMIWFPLLEDQTIIGGLILEIFQHRQITRSEMVSFSFLAKNYARNLAYLGRKHPGFTRLGRRRIFFPVKTFIVIAILLVGFIDYLKLKQISQPIVVGGSGVLNPLKKHVAYMKIDGVIKKVFVRHNSRVETGDTLATVEAEPILQEIRAEQAQVAIYKNQIKKAERESIEKPEMRSEIKVLNLRLKKSMLMIDQLKWKLTLLSVKAPIDGMVATENVSTRQGKFMKAGDEFCLIAAPRPLELEVKIRETDIAYVKQKANVEFFLNAMPENAITCKVRQIAPIAETDKLTGENFFIVRAEITEPPQVLRPGMKGLAKIQGREYPILYILRRRIVLFFKRLVY